LHDESQVTMPRGPVVAVVDDDRSVCVAVRRLLQASGYHVLVFSSAEEFLEERRDVDCLILDIGLPGISGLELAGRMETSHASTPIVFVTARDDSATRETMRRAGRAWVQKPCPGDLLLEAVAHATTVPTSNG
jgi:FixJ family two-component response regulator